MPAGQAQSQMPTVVAQIDVFVTGLFAGGCDPNLI
jgi:hypothetical protein